ncbi:MAG: chaperonin GroEL [Planctomycetota bacterium]|nr:chaperonin GroEL [Planctomycetota bacterium]
MATAKQMAFDDDARNKIHAGVRKLADAVRITMGPLGRTVILEKKFGMPVVTKDGVTVSKEIELEDPFENLGAKMVNEIASKTSDMAGDGTTTATLLAEAIFGKGLKRILGGVNPMALRRGIEKSVAAAVAEIEGISRPVKDRKQIAHVATLSANNDAEIGDLLADAMEKVKKDGIITVEEGNSTETIVDYHEGLMFDKGYISPYFITDPKSMTAELENPHVLLHEKKISNLQELVPILEKVAQAGSSLVIISEEIEGEALAALVVNKLRGVLKVAAAKAPGFGDRRKAMLEDMAVITKGQVISEELGAKLADVPLSSLGVASHVTIGKDHTTIIGKGNKSKVAERIEQIKHLMETTTSDYDKEKLQERLGKLSGGAAVIQVGALTEVAMKERKSRIEQALNATKAAVEEGIVPGGGVACLRGIPAVKALKLRGDERHGQSVIAEALEAPLRQIAENAGIDGTFAVEEVGSRKGAFGMDVRTGEYGDLFKLGIVDPTKVTRTALENAASLAGLMLTTNTLITDLEDKDPADERALEGIVR